MGKNLFNVRNMVFSIHGAGSIGYPFAKEGITTQWSMRLNIKHECVNFYSLSVENLWDIELGNEFLDLTHTLRKSIGREVNTLTLTKCKGLAVSKSPCERSGKTSYRLRETERHVANLMSDKGPGTRRWKGLSKPNGKPSDQSSLSTYKGLRHFTKQDPQMANEHVERCSWSRATRNCKLKPQHDVTAQRPEWVK